ncbi:hypothetical protein [Paraburkholderia hayleyella]|uniref:hypothetical protein n=1 Tax=Paraburkholderia hayleyella TaxID=2152889 RepID=UPI001291D8DE|nr:hypothetical protein [Paraburkholderia hayleyella]
MSEILKSASNNNLTNYNTDSNNVTGRSINLDSLSQNNRATQAQPMFFDKVINSQSGTNTPDGKILTAIKKLEYPKFTDVNQEINLSTQTPNNVKTICDSLGDLEKMFTELVSKEGDQALSKLILSLGRRIYATEEINLISSAFNLYQIHIDGKNKVLQIRRECKINFSDKKYPSRQELTTQNNNLHNIIKHITELDERKNHLSQNVKADIFIKTIKEQIPEIENFIKNTRLNFKNNKESAICVIKEYRSALTSLIKSIKNSHIKTGDIKKSLRKTKKEYAENVSTPDPLVIKLVDAFCCDSYQIYNEFLKDTFTHSNPDEFVCNLKNPDSMQPVH